MCCVPQAVGRICEAWILFGNFYSLPSPESGSVSLREGFKWIRARRYIIQATFSVLAQISYPAEVNAAACTVLLHVHISGDVLCDERGMISKVSFSYLLVAVCVHCQFLSCNI